MAQKGWDHLQFAAWVHAQLRSREWNATDLANRMGKEPSVVSRWLSGQRRPNSESCDLIADALGVDTDVVLTLVGHRPGKQPISPTDEREAIIDLLWLIEPTQDRLGGLKGTLQNWYEIDRTRKGGKRT